MSYKSEDLSPPSSPVLLIGFAGLTHQQAMDHQYPVAPLEPGYTDGGPYYLGTNTGPWGSARMVPVPPPLFPLSGFASGNRIIDQVAPGNSVPTRARAQVPDPPGVRLPAAALSSVQNATPVRAGFVATPSSDRTALMARLTNEVMNSTPVFGIRPQLANFRAMPIHRQLSLRDNYDNFRRNINSYWEAAAGYVVGDVAAVPCTQCRRGRRMFTECVVVRRPGGGPQPMSGACTGCHYGHQGLRCEHHDNFGSTS
ncbi:hypothetical protein EYC84_001445 [Monilinia fructicola]|uniref:Uncharacterized protein n=1 Tax=Monilinia fructicola TaxID=38448 RepID=A0A5M9JPM6_MONFR|nr:hypothetical protein EYC84_001445 [Monilinia fructicola]